MQQTYEILSQRHSLETSFLFHHLQPNITGCHLLHVSHICFTYHLAKQKQNLRLAIGQCITFNMVAVVVEVHSETTAQSFLILL